MKGTSSTPIPKEKEGERKKEKKKEKERVGNKEMKKISKAQGCSTPSFRVVMTGHAHTEPHTGAEVSGQFSNVARPCVKFKKKKKKLRRTENAAQCEGPGVFSFYHIKRKKEEK